MHPLEARIDLEIFHHPTYLLIIVNKGLSLSGNKEFFSSFEVRFDSVTLQMGLLWLWYSSQTLLFRLPLFNQFLHERVL
jgi:hypothetical protein